MFIGTGLPFFENEGSAREHYALEATKIMVSAHVKDAMANRKDLDIESCKVLPEHLMLHCSKDYANNEEFKAIAKSFITQSTKRWVSDVFIIGGDDKNIYALTLD